MKFRIYSVFDDKAECFMPPFNQSTEGIALRVFSDACRQPDHPFQLNTADYHLYDLGEYDDQTGKIICNKAPRLVLSGEEVVKSLELLGMTTVDQFREGMSNGK